MDHSPTSTRGDSARGGSARETADERARPGEAGHGGGGGGDGGGDAEGPRARGEVAGTTAGTRKCPACGNDRADLSLPCPHCGAAALPPSEIDAQGNARRGA